MPRLLLGMAVAANPEQSSSGNAGVTRTVHGDRRHRPYAPAPPPSKPFHFVDIDPTCALSNSQAPQDPR